MQKPTNSVGFYLSP
jgi:hypothetical protein